MRSVLMLSCVVALPSGCASAHLDVRPLCDRVTAMESAGEFQRHVELEDVADLAVRMSPERFGAQQCGDDLQSWLARELSTRPLALDTALLPKIDAMGVLCRYDAWSDKCVQALASIVLLPERESRLVMHRAQTFPGPGSQVIDLGLQPVISLPAVRLRAATALSRGSPGVTPRYVAFLKRVWADPSPSLHQIFVTETG